MSVGNGSESKFVCDGSLSVTEVKAGKVLGVPFLLSGGDMPPISRYPYRYPNILISLPISQYPGRYPDIPISRYRDIGRDIGISVGISGYLDIGISAGILGLDIWISGY
ncbi:hypothetical protein Fcan01_26421 [Folsomia candida]|uniref:Uncharacterized protein n=1 Tax=Folsomia candida TaxID=158441 RepID=A0A226D2A1_FOLCA|nr:hypothetical protein Fcan01_26421 [Folsomia candida]